MTFTTGGSVTFLFSFEGGNTLNQAIPAFANLTTLFGSHNTLHARIISRLLIRRYDNTVRRTEQFLSHRCRPGLTGATQ